MPTRLRKIYYSFPIRLIALHLRNHLVLVFIWIFLALFSTGVIGKFFGIHYLLLTPEYRGEVDFWSFFITGSALGALFMIWNLTTYLLSAHRFAFLATLEAPFSKYCLNNAVIPLAYLTTYLFATVHFQWYDELSPFGVIFSNIAGFLLGIVVLTGLLALYLRLTNKDIVSFLSPGHFVPRPGGKLLAPGRRLPTLFEIQTGSTRWRVDTYLNERLHLRWVRSVSHYNPEILARVFRQNHLNAVVVQGVALVLVMISGLFMDSEWMRVPTGTSIFMIASMMIAVYGAVVFWFRQWGALVMIVLLVVLNITTGFGWFTYRNRAYGIDYSLEKRATYSYAELEALCGPDQLKKDVAETKKILEAWLAKNRTAGHQKPKMVFLCVSGGGMRSAVWTLNCLQQADSATDGRLFRQTVLMSGASGGILGAAYFREVYRRELEGGTLSSRNPVLVDDIGRDLLNPVSFALASNDFFFPFGSFKSGNFTYRKDRGYILEKQLNENCRNYLTLRLAHYRDPERTAQIPMLVVTPFIVNDARRLIISPHNLSYLMRPPDNKRGSLQTEIDAVDFKSMFDGQQADSLAFTTALRMNCTYPLILPNVWLPTKPAIEAIDAGFRDNYGLLTVARFIQVFQDWIQENTGGVVIVQMRCFEKIDAIGPSDSKGIVQSLFTPAEAAGSLTTVQDYEQDNILSMLDDMLGENMLEMLRFSYRPVRKANEASMSLHLSNREKLDLHYAFKSPENQAGLRALKAVLDSK